MRDIITILVLSFIFFAVLIMIERVFIHSDEIKLCIKKEFLIKPLTKCPLSQEKEGIVCFTAKYHGEDLFGNYYKISCDSTQIEIPKSLPKFVVFINKRKQ